MDIAAAVNSITADVAGAADALRADLAGAAEERATLMRPFTDANGPWRFAPAGEIRKAEAAIVAEQKQRQGEKLFALSKALNQGGPALEQLREQTRLAPSAEVAWAQRTGEAGVTADRLLNLSSLDELRQARFSRELLGASPVQVLEAYRQASLDPTEQGNASLIRWIERQHTAGYQWPGDTAAGSKDLAADAELTKTIRAAKDARVPAYVTEAAALLAEAAKIKAEAALHKVAQARPK